MTIPDFPACAKFANWRALEVRRNGAKRADSVAIATFREDGARPADIRAAVGL